MARKSGTPIRLLLADDSITIHKVVSLTFASENVVIDAVMDGAQAIERAAATSPDIVLADVFMPEPNGYQVCAAIKSEPKLAGTPVVLLVGTFEPFDELEASRVRCDAYLTKPFDTSELVQIVKSLVDRKPAAAGHGGEAAALAAERRASAAAGALDPGVPLSALASPRARESFLGSNSILDLFEGLAPEAPAANPAVVEASAPEPVPARPQPEEPAPHVIPFPGTRSPQPDTIPVALTDELVDLVVEKVIKRMSPDIVREIAWEVVPEMSEILIRQYLEELKNSGRP